MEFYDFEMLIDVTFFLNMILNVIIKDEKKIQSGPAVKVQIR